MMTQITVLVSIMLVFVMMAAADEPARVHHKPTWESLDQHRTPEWFMDAKLGFKIQPPHPTEAEYQAYWAKRGEPNKEYLYGAGAWDKAKWDPDGLAQLAVDMGARYVVFSHGTVDVFLNHPSKYADIEGSPFTSYGPPGRDMLGEVAEAVRKRGLRFGIYLNYLHPDRYPLWPDLMREVVERYQPVTLWFDGERMSDTADKLKSREFLAWYYNQASNPGELAAEDGLGRYKLKTWHERLVHGDWYRKELGAAAGNFSDGYYVRWEALNYADPRSPLPRPNGLVANYVHWLCHTASHGGNLEIQVWASPTAQFEAGKHALLGVGHWLKINGEAIYGTRPWYDGRAQSSTDDGVEVRYTAKGDSVYAILLDWDAPFTLPHLQAAEGTTVEMLGRKTPDGKLPWKQTPEGMFIEVTPNWQMPNPPGFVSSHGVSVPCDHAYSFKITPRPTWTP